MKILSIGTDRKLFEEGSAVSTRIREYGARVEEYHVIVFALSSLNLKPKQLSENVWLYPTNSWSRLLYARDTVALAKNIVLKNKFVRGLSVITTQDPFECGWAGLKIKNKWRIPLEVQLHTDPSSPYFTGLLNGIRKVMAKKVLKKADGVRVVSEYLKASILGSTRGLISVLPIYVDQERIEGGKVAFDVHARYPWHFIILMVCRLEPEKNIVQALKVLALVRRRFQDTGLLIVGSGSEENNLKKVIIKLNLTGAVAFTAWQNNLSSFYKTANIFLQTSYFEGYGLSLVEAGLSNLPVVTTPVGIANELEHGKDAYIYPVNRTELFAEGIVDLIEHNHKRENLRVNLKNTLQSILLTKEEYLNKLVTEWENIAKRSTNWG